MPSLGVNPGRTAHPWPLWLRWVVWAIASIGAVIPVQMLANRLSQGGSLEFIWLQLRNPVAWAEYLLPILITHCVALLPRKVFVGILLAFLVFWTIVFWTGAAAPDLASGLPLSTAIGSTIGGWTVILLPVLTGLWLAKLLNVPMYGQGK